MDALYLDKCGFVLYFAYFASSVMFRNDGECLWYYAATVNESEQINESGFLFIYLFLSKSFSACQLSTSPFHSA